MKVPLVVWNLTHSHDPPPTTFIVQIARSSIWPVAGGAVEAAPAPANPTVAVMASPAANAATHRNVSSSHRRRGPPFCQRSPGVSMHQILAGRGESCPLKAELRQHDVDRESGAPNRCNRVSVEYATGQSASQISDLFEGASSWAGIDQGLEVPARRDPGDRDGHAVNEQGSAYLRRETRLMEYVERPLLSSGEPVYQDLSL